MTVNVEQNGGNASVTVPDNIGGKTVTKIDAGGTGITVEHNHSFENGKCKVCQAIDPDHTHKGGTASCTAKAVCDICGQEYGELGEHSFTNLICKDLNAVPYIYIYSIEYICNYCFYIQSSSENIVNTIDSCYTEIMGTNFSRRKKDTSDCAGRIYF